MKVLYLSIFIISLVSIMIIPNALGAVGVPWATIFVEKPILELPYTAWDDNDYVKMKIFGTVEDPRSSGYIYMTITKPDGDISKAKVRPSPADGEYSTFILICCNEVGKYTVSATWVTELIGIVSFDVIQQSKSQQTITSTPTAEPVTAIPSWIKNHAGWWADGLIDDSSYLIGIQYLIEEEILVISTTRTSDSTGSQEIPTWIKNSAGWWADGLIDNPSYLIGIQYLIEEEIIKVG